MVKMEDSCGEEGAMVMEEGQTKTGVRTVVEDMAGVYKDTLLHRRSREVVGTQWIRIGAPECSWQ